MGNKSRFWELPLNNEEAVGTDFTYFYLFLFSDSNHLLYLVLLNNPTVFLGSTVSKSEIQKNFKASQLYDSLFSHFTDKC